MFNGIIFNNGKVNKVLKRSKGINIFLKTNLKLNKLTLLAELFSAGNLKTVFTAKTYHNIFWINLKFSFALNLIFFSKINVIPISSF